MIKLLHTADLHLGAPFRGLPPELAAQRREEQRKLPEQLAELCREAGCSLWLISGDLLDGENVSRDTMDALLRGLSMAEVPVFIAPGNHDPVSLDSPYRRERWPENVHIFREPALQSMALPGLDCRVWGAGYQSMDCPPLLDGFRARGPERFQVMALHGEVGAPGSPYCPVQPAQIRESGLTYLALGHIHKAGRLTAGSTLCAWPGCPMGRGFDETGDKGALVVTLSDEGAHAAFAPLDNRRYVSIETEVGADPLTAILEALPQDARRDLCRITLTGSAPEPDLEVLRLALRDRVGWLELRDRTTPPEDLWRAAGADSLEGVYFRILQEALDRADPETRGHLERAARLSRRLLDGREVTLP